MFVKTTCFPKYSTALVVGLSGCVVSHRAGKPLALRGMDLPKGLGWWSLVGCFATKQVSSDDSGNCMWVY